MPAAAITVLVSVGSMGKFIHSGKLAASKISRPFFGLFSKMGDLLQVHAQKPLAFGKQHNADGRARS